MQVAITPARHGSTWDSLDAFPSRFVALRDGMLSLADEGTHFGFLNDGIARLECAAGCFELRAGMYFACPGALSIDARGTGFVVTRAAWRGFFMLGGPIECEGRLRYIDGCSDSLLIPPVVFGDPCLNLLYLPPGTTQTAHTHPSVRFGMIVSGQGLCKTPTQDFALAAGLVFHIAPAAMHSFHTQASPLRVIAWHPDSDCGPRHHDHPMINRTIIDGIPASQRKEYAQESTLQTGRP